MLILTIRTDRPEAEIGLYDAIDQLASHSWLAHRQLAETIHLKIEDLLKSYAYSWSDLDGLIVFKGPGSFTGLRIGFSTANTLAYSLQIPIVALGGEAWIKHGMQALAKGFNEQIVLPEYGALANITLPKK